MSEEATAYRERVVFWDRRGRAGTEHIFELEVSMFEFPERTYFLEHVYDTVAGKASSQIIAASRDHIRVSDDMGRSWRSIALPERGQYCRCFTARSGRHLLLRDGDDGGVHLFDRNWAYLGRREPSRLPWHGTWSVDQSRAGTIMFAEYGHEGGMMRVLRSEDDGDTWNVAFETLAEVKHLTEPNAIRHFHTCQADPFEAGVWWLSSGDIHTQNKLWSSRDDGVTWNEVLREHSPEAVDRVPERRQRHLNRHTAEVFTERFIYWATDDNLASFARLVRSPRSLEPGPIEAVTTLSRNEARSFFPLGDGLYGVISEAKHDVSHAQLFCLDLEGTLLVRFDLPNPSLRASGFCRSRSSRAALDGVLFSFTDGQMVEPGTQLLKWQVRRSSHADSERDRLALFDRVERATKSYGTGDAEAQRLAQRYAAHFQCNVCADALEDVFCASESSPYEGVLEPRRFWDVTCTEYPCPHCGSRARARTGRVLRAKHLRNRTGTALLVSESLGEVRHLSKTFSSVTHVSLQGEFGDPNIVKGTDITQMPHIQDSAFNLYWASCVLDYIPNLPAVAREAYRVLAPGGEFAFLIMPYRLLQDGTGCVVKHRNALSHEKYAQQAGGETGVPDCRFGVGYVLDVFREAGLAIRREFVFDAMSRTSQSWFIACKPAALVK